MGPSVRGPHYMPDMNIHAKIPVDLFHKLPCDMFRIEFQCLCACPFNFEICGIFEELLAITAIPRITVLNFTTKPQLLRNKKKTLRTWELRSLMQLAQRSNVVSWLLRHDERMRVNIILFCVYDRQSYYLKNCKYYRNILKNARSLQCSG